MNDDYKPAAGLIFESIFDVLYLLFDLVAAFYFFFKADGNRAVQLFGFLTLLLGAGDAFHLLPRVEDHLKGPSEARTWKMQLGVAVSSVTMTVFYILLYYIFLELYPEKAVPEIYPVLIWATALFRMVYCFLPANGWFTGEERLKASLMRNIPFAVTGIMVMLLYFKADPIGAVSPARIGTGIIVSFACYLPVCFWAKKKPALGALMMPKTLAYVYIIWTGLKLVPELV